MTNLTLPVNDYWGGMIEDGTLDWDYREVKPYWVSRMCSCPSGTTDIDVIKKSLKEFKTATFYNRSSKKRMVFEVKVVEIVGGDDYDFFNDGKYYFIIGIGKRIC